MARLDPKTQYRAAELVGLGLSHTEAAGAVGIGSSSVDRLMQKPEYRKVAEDVRRQRTSVAAEVGSVIRDLLSAVNKDGNPDMALRQRGAELYSKNPALIDALEELSDDDLLPGVVLRFPMPEGKQDQSLDGLVSDISDTTPPSGDTPYTSPSGDTATVTFSPDDLAEVPDEDAA